MLGLPGNRVLPENYDKAKKTEKYLKTKSLFKELKFFCSEEKKERLSCMYETTQQIQRALIAVQNGQNIAQICVQNFENV